MIDHILGKPSPSWKRLQILLILACYVMYLRRADANGPRAARFLTTRLAKFTPWQIVVGCIGAMYMFKNVDRLLGLGQPEPLARLYSRQFYRGTWILTALDAGFWTAMPIPYKPLRDFMCIVFSAYYAVFADQADEKVRKVRATITLEQIRVSWEKMLNPYLRLLTFTERPRISVRRKVLMKRSRPHDKRDTTIWMYYDGPKGSLSQVRNIVLDFPGGGFVCMPPPCHEDRLMQWAKNLSGTLILSVDYGKAPEYPYPWAIQECFDVYRFLLETKGRKFGIQGVENLDELRIVITGDSAGGNLATGCMINIIEHNIRSDRAPLRKPDALLLLYPALDFDIRAWMDQSKVGILKASVSTGNMPGIENILESKDHMGHKSPLSVVPDATKHRRKRTLSWRSLHLPGHSPSGEITMLTSRTDEDYDNDESEFPLQERVKIEDFDFENGVTDRDTHVDVTRPTPERKEIHTRLAMTSRMSFFNDRILTPDLMRAMSILYIGPNEAPDLVNDYYVSPINTPLSILAQFPKVYIVCGEKDPLVDDSVVFAGLLRKANMQKVARRRHTFEMSGMEDIVRSDDEIVELRILEGMSHAFVQMLSLVPDAKRVMRYMEAKMRDVFNGTASGISSTKISRIYHDREQIQHKQNGSLEDEDEQGLVFQSKRNRLNNSSIECKEKGLVPESDLMRNRRQDVVHGLL